MSQPSSILFEAFGLSSDPLPVDTRIEAEPILKFFAFGHLPPPLREVSGQFYDVAVWIVENIPRSAERTVALRKLLEGKDAAVRAALP